MTRRYTLVDCEAIPEPDLFKWAQWFETADLQVAYVRILDADISTVFLGLDCAFNDSDPILFETMIFGGEHDNYHERYSTLEEAMLGHERAVGLVTGYTTEAP